MQLAKNNIFNLAIKGLYTELLIKGRSTKGKISRATILASKATTPNNLLGIERKIA